MGICIDANGRYHDTETGQFVEKSGVSVDYGNYWDNGYGVTNTSSEKDGVREAESFDALIAIREENEKQRQIDLNRQEQQRKAREEEELDKYKTQAAKPRRKAMSKKYEVGNTFQSGDSSYKIVGTFSVEDKFAGYMAQDSTGALVFIDKYGAVRSEFPQRYKDV